MAWRVGGSADGLGSWCPCSRHSFGTANLPWLARHVRRGQHGWQRWHSHKWLLERGFLQRLIWATGHPGVGCSSMVPVPSPCAGKHHILAIYSTQCKVACVIISCKEHCLPHHPGCRLALGFAWLQDAAQALHRRACTRLQTTGLAANLVLRAAFYYEALHSCTFVLQGVVAGFNSQGTSGIMESNGKVTPFTSSSSGKAKGAAAPGPVTSAGGAPVLLPRVCAGLPRSSKTHCSAGLHVLCLCKCWSSLAHNSNIISQHTPWPCQWPPHTLDYH